MDDETLLEKLKALTVWSGHREISVEDMATFQAKEIKGLMELGAFTRPKHEAALNQFLEENWKPLQDAVNKQDFQAFEAAFHRSVEAANAYHELKDKPYIGWKLPDTPPPDL